LVFHLRTLALLLRKPDLGPKIAKIEFTSDI